MRAVNLRSENEGLAKAETGRRKSSCPDQEDRSRPDRESSQGSEAFHSTALSVKTRRQEGRGHGPVSSC